MHSALTLLVALASFPCSFLEWEHNKHENIMTFRDHPHRSIMTGTMAPVHHTPWLTAFDDSIECYVDGNKPGGGKL